MDGTVRAWDVATGRQRQLLTSPDPENRPEFLTVAYSPDGTRIAAGGTTGTGIVWDAATGAALYTLPGHLIWVADVAFSPDGSRLATASSGGIVKLWDAATGEEMATIAGHTGEPLGIAFSPDGTQLATAGLGSKAILWDARTGEALLTLTGHSGVITSLAFSPDGAQLATSGFVDHTVRIYVLRTADLATLARSRLTRTLTAEECRQYLHLDQCPATP